MNKNITFHGNCIIKGFPIIGIDKDAMINVGDNVTLNSVNKGYHGSMYSPVKLFADRKDAEINIGKNTRIHGSCLHAIKKISIGQNCLISANCNIIDSNGHDISFDDLSKRQNITNKAKNVIIEDYVWIGMNSLILPGENI